MKVNKEKINNIKHRIVDIYHLLFRDAHFNYYRIEKEWEDKDGFKHWDMKFDSYYAVRKFQKKLRRMSLGFFTSLLITTTIVSLTLNLSTGPIGDSMAANYGWQQSDWSTENSSVTDIHEDALDGSTDHTVYSSKDAGTVAGTNLSISKTSANWNEDNTFDTYDAANTDSNILVSGGGDYFIET